MYVYVSLLFFIMALAALSKLNNIVKELTLIRRSLNQISNHMDLPEPQINDELRTLVQEGRHIEAVRLARETLGLSLIAGKKHIDQLEAELKEDKDHEDE